MDEILSSLLPLGLAIYSILLVIKSWPHKKTALLRASAVILGATLGILTMGWPEGLITGLAAAAVAPFLFKKLTTAAPTVATSHEEKVEEGPPKNVQIHIDEEGE